MASKTRVGMRALTMQQPFAAAMAHGQGLFTRRGKTMKFKEGGEWVAIHCGSNDAHMKNVKLMSEIRAKWPECPSDEALKAGQRSIIGAAHFVEGDVDAKSTNCL